MSKLVKNIHWSLPVYHQSFSGLTDKFLRSKGAHDSIQIALYEIRYSVVLIRNDSLKAKNVNKDFPLPHLLSCSLK